MKTIIVGCGRAGATLADRLFRAGHKVSIIDEVKANFDNLSADFRGHPIEGNALHQNILRNAGIQEADSIACVTNLDALNVVVAHVARTLYNIPNVVVRVYDPHRRSLYDTFGLHYVSSVEWSAQRIEELLRNPNAQTVFSCGNGEVELYEIAVSAAWNGRSMHELLSGGHALPVSLTRVGKAILPTPDTRLEQGDVVYVSATAEGFVALQERLNK